MNTESNSSAPHWSFGSDHPGRSDPAPAAVHEDTKRLELLKKHCRIVYYPGGNAYPIEHAPGANKDMFDQIMQALAAAPLPPTKAGEEKRSMGIPIDPANTAENSSVEEGK